MQLSKGELEFIHALTAEGVRYLVIGGRAVQHFCPERQTEDLDILLGDGDENFTAAMTAMGKVDPRYFRQEWKASHRRPNVQAPVALWPTHADVLTSLPAVDFDSAWTRRVVVPCGEYEVPVLSRKDLIANKLADIERMEKSKRDLELLRKLDP